MTGRTAPDQSHVSQSTNIVSPDALYVESTLSNASKGYIIKVCKVKYIEMTGKLCKLGEQHKPVIEQGQSRCE